MRIERGDRDARLGDAGALRIMRSTSSIASVMLSGIDAVERLAQRLMPGDARHPLAVEHVHLGEIGLVAEQDREHLVLVGELPAAVVHARALLSGAKVMPSISPALEKSIARASVSPVSRPDSALALPSGILLGIGVAEVHELHRAAAPICRLRRGNPLDLQLHAGMFHAHVEHAGIADHDEARDVGEAVVGEDARDLFGADAGAVAGGQRDDGQFIGAGSHIESLGSLLRLLDLRGGLSPVLAIEFAVPFRDHN